MHPVANASKTATAVSLHLYSQPYVAMDFVDGRGVQQTIPVVHSATSTTMCCGDATAATCSAADSCDGAGTCDPRHTADGTTCEAGAFCTVGDACAAGACVEGSAPACGTDEGCDETADGLSR